MCDNRPCLALPPSGRASSERKLSPPGKPRTRMIAFSCSHCRKPLRVQDNRAGKLARCPGCGPVSPVPTPTPAAAPSGPSPADARTEAPGPPPAPAVSEDNTVPPGPGQDTCSPDPAGAKPAPPAEQYDFLAPPQSPDELGRLGSYR